MDKQIRIWCFGLLVLVLPACLKANMANPIQKGTLAATPFVAQHAEILNAQIVAQLDSICRQARFTVRYVIWVEEAKPQVPFLFYAADYLEDFQLTLDGEPQTISPLPASFGQDPGPHFSEVFPADDWDQSLRTYLSFGEGQRYTVAASDYQFFEADLSAGRHTLTVSYLANQWTDRRDWVQAFSFRYALAPARQWRHLRKLTLTWIPGPCLQEWKTNLGPPQQISDQQQSWSYTFAEGEDLPWDYWLIKYQPPISAFAKFLIWLGPTGLAGIAFVVLGLIHNRRLYRRSQNPTSPAQHGLVVGALLIPLLALVTYWKSFVWIDRAIGEAASGYHGYPFLVVVYLPLIALGYGVATWALTRWLYPRL